MGNVWLSIIIRKSGHERNAKVAEQELRFKLLVCVCVWVLRRERLNHVLVLI